MVSLSFLILGNLSPLSIPPPPSRAFSFSHIFTVFYNFDKISFIQSSCIARLMTSQGRPLPKFGEWDVNNPASADGFTVIFAKARDEKKTNGTAATSGGGAPGQKRDDNTPYKPPEPYQYPPTEKKWFCCF